MTAIAVCFLVKERVRFPDVWDDFFRQSSIEERSLGRKLLNVYAHVKKKTRDTQAFLTRAAVPRVRTTWCGEGLVVAWVKMLEAALRDKRNVKFVLVSEECVPLYEFRDMYTRLVEDDDRSVVNVRPRFLRGLHYADQWMALNRSDARNLCDMLRDASYLKRMRAKLCSRDGDCACPDEYYPINWLTQRHGDIDSETFRRGVATRPLTYTVWGYGSQNHPTKINLKMWTRLKAEVCASGALFARKFTKDAVSTAAFSCSSANNTSRRKKKTTNK